MSNLEPFDLDEMERRYYLQPTIILIGTRGGMRDKLVEVLASATEEINYLKERFGYIEFVPENKPDTGDFSK